MSNERLRDALMRQGLTPVTVAEEVGVDPKSVERWIIQGRIPYPRHRHLIAAMVRETESYLWPDATPAEKTAALSRSEVVQVYPRRIAVADEVWRRLIDQAHERIGLLAYAGLFLVEQHPRLIPTLKAKAEAGVKIEILLGDPAADEIAVRSTEEGAAGVMQAKIHNVLQYYVGLRDVTGVSVRFHRTTLYNSIYRFDDEMMVNTHVFGFPAPHAPVLHLRRLGGGELFDTYADSFDRVLSASQPAWPADVARLGRESH